MAIQTAIKKCFVVAILVSSSFCYGQNDGDFIVERYLVTTYGGKLSHSTQFLEERRKYSESKKIIYKVNFQGKFFFDSVYYEYARDTLVRITKYFNLSDFKIKKKYDIRLNYENGKLKNIESFDNKYGLSTEQLDDYYSEPLNKVDLNGFKNPLNLLNKELQDLNLPDRKYIGEKILKNGIVRKEYKSVPVPNVLLAYGMLHETLFNKCFTYSNKQNLLLEDEFEYEDFTVRRSYKYEKDLVKSIHILILNKYGTIVRSDSIKFNYKFLAVASMPK